jgi:hypothetical protein
MSQQKSARGGAGRGQGRKKQFKSRIVVRVTAAQLEAFHALGGSDWFRAALAANNPLNRDVQGV